MKDCIFCKIVKGEAPSYKVYEDDLFYGFLDIYPMTRGHSLLIPKRHFRWVQDVEPYGKYWETARKLLNATQRAFGREWVQFLTHGLIPHAHIHIIPRYEDITKAPILTSKKLQFSKEEFEAIAKKIRGAL